MVFWTRVLWQSGKSNFRSKQRKQSSFIDQLRIYVKGGGGGQGLRKYGGHGGRGGHVYLICDETSSLKKVLSRNRTKRFIAGNGVNCMRNILLGEAGNDVMIEVPPGIVAVNDAGQPIGEVNEVGETVLLARGGDGGGPHNRFMGQKGHSHSVKLDLKLIADIGLVGFPNAGKSTLLSALSRASPRIASYPFTTITPNIGLMEYEDTRQISMADLPGLIEGAHYNVGMGHSFLKHVERTKVLLFMVDMHGFQLGPKHPFRTPLQTILLLNKELELYKEELVQKPAVLALNKIDLAENESQVEEIVEQVKHIHEHTHVLEEKLRPETIMTFSEIFPISAKEQHHTDRMKSRLRSLLDFYADLEKEEDQKYMKLQQRKLHDNEKLLHEFYNIPMT